MVILRYDVIETAARAVTEPYLGRPVFNALVAQMSSHEALELLRQHFGLSPYLREKSAMRLSRLRGSGTEAEEAFIDAIDFLVSRFNGEPACARKAFYPARILGEAASATVREQLIDTMLSIQSKGALDQCCVLMELDWNERYLGFLLDRLPDGLTFRAASLLLRQGSKEQLLEHSEVLVLAFGREMLRRILARLGNQGVTLFPLCKAYGPVEELYAYVKADLTPSHDEAQRLLLSAYGDSEFALAVWCIAFFGYTDLVLQVWQQRATITDAWLDRARRLSAP